MTGGRELHRQIKDRVTLALGPRSWSWLARQSGIPKSTLLTQARRPKFALDVFLLIAHTLGKDIAYFLPPDVSSRPGSENGLETRIARIERLLARQKNGAEHP